MLGMATHMVNPEMANAFAEHFQVESCSLPQEGTFPMDQSFTMMTSMKAEKVICR